MQKCSSTWSAEAWSEAYARALAYVFELPHARTVGSAESRDVVRAPLHSMGISDSSQNAVMLTHHLVISFCREIKGATSVKCRHCRAVQPGLFMARLPDTAPAALNPIRKLTTSSCGRQASIFAISQYM